MKTQYYSASTLDGFIADPHDSLDWLLQFEDGAGDSFTNFIEQVGAAAMGSATYEWLLHHHVFPPAGEPQPWPYQQPVWVFSTRTLPTVPGANLHFVAGDVRPVHQQMAAAAGDKNIWLVGGGELVGQFYDAGLLDELIIQIAAVTLGRGKPLLPRTITKPPLRLLSATPLGTAFVELRYEVQK